MEGPTPSRFDPFLRISRKPPVEQGGIETLYFHEHSDLTVMGAVGSMHKVFTAFGLMGGYPSPCSYHWTAKFGEQFRRFWDLDDSTWTTG